MFHTEIKYYFYIADGNDDKLSENEENGYLCVVEDLPLHL